MTHTEHRARERLWKPEHDQAACQGRVDIVSFRRRRRVYKENEIATHPRALLQACVIVGENLCLLSGSMQAAAAAAALGCQLRVARAVAAKF